jgi:outer membrane cobalamin receptor
MKTLFSVICFLFLSFICFAHEGTLQGFVLDENTKKPLVGAVVHLTIPNQFAITNDIGEFKIKGLSPQQHELSISYIGYETLKQKTRVVDGETTTITYYMKVGTVSLEEVSVHTQNAHSQQLINKIDIQLRPISNSQEVLRMVPGLFIGQHAGGGKAEQIFLRGFDLDHGTDIRLTADGIPVNMVSHAHGQGYADLHFIIPELIENVAFKKGTYYADKGNFSTAGWVDFRTKNILERNFFKTEIGQFDTFRGLLGCNLLKTEKQSLYMATEYNYSDSYFDSPQHFKRFNLFCKYVGSLTNKTYLNLSVSRFYSQWNHSGQIPDRAVADGAISFYGAIDNTEGGETSRTNINAQFYTLTNRGDLLKNQVYVSNYTFDLYSNFTFFLNDPLNGDQIRQAENRNLVGYSGSYTFKNKEGEITIGLDYRHDFTKNSELSHTKDRVEIIDRIKYGNINEANTGVYLDKNITLANRWLFNIGLRYDMFLNRYTDHLTNTDSKALTGQLLPKINAYYTPSSQLQIYWLSGKSFHSNDTRVVVAQGGNQTLPPAYGTDVGFNWKPFSKLFINMAAWYLWLGQEFVYVGDAGVVEPSGKTKRKGVDVSLRYQIGKKLFLDTDINITHPRSLEAEVGKDYIPLAPIFTSVGGFTYQNQQGFSGSLRYRYMGNRPANEDNTIVAKGYFVADLQLNYTQKHYQIGISVNNIFNTQWKETQFATESRLKNEIKPVEEIHFTAGSPFFARITYTMFF